MDIKRNYPGRVKRGLDREANVVQMRQNESDLTLCSVPDEYGNSKSNRGRTIRRIGGVETGKPVEETNRLAGRDDAGFWGDCSVLHWTRDVCALEP